MQPAAWLYKGITALRNKLYDQGVFASFTPAQFTVSVGNLTVGGTGKTPMVEYLIRYFKDKQKIATLSRGYGRSTKGFRVADPGATARTIGDEPLQYYQKFGAEIKVTVCENRAEGSRQITALFPDVDLLLLDDAYQHRGIRPSVNILLNDYNRPFYNDHPFPAGYLREGRSGATRADAVVVTKCPAGLAQAEKEEIKQQISRYTRHGTPVFFASVRYEQPVAYAGEEEVLPEQVVALAGIARPEPFLAYLRDNFEVVKEVIYPDHHDYSPSDLKDLLKYVKKGTFVVTTEKDKVKLYPLATAAGVVSQFLYLPIRMDFGDDQNLFEQWLDKAVQVPLLNAARRN
ncbi:tetraacyldisaccharide 4'-kinase [Telluribacter humicola]